uniref:protein-tyrosine-phosphatase n=1 Tax=Oryzias melastigma TaxID=30732 RepID=A0A3B3E261_ORYME
YSRVKQSFQRSSDLLSNHRFCESLQLKKQLGLTSEVGAQKENIKKNRYKDILPYDQCRVVLSQSTTESSSDYINAMFVLQGVTGDCRYVACQGPLGPTLVDFWRMIWQLDIKVRAKKKCECYWASAQRPAAFGPFTISTSSRLDLHTERFLNCTNPSFLSPSSSSQETRSVVQYQFVSWPDHDVPYETDGVLDLLRKVRGSQGPHSSPLLVHCSAGCGRTGVICALDYINDLLVSKKITADFSILKVVLDLRMQRPSAVQTKVSSDGDEDAALTCLGFCMERKYTHPDVSISEETDPQSFLFPLRSLPFSHHYDNEPSGASAAPIYSTVKPKLKPHSLPPSATPIYDIAKPSRQSWEGREYHLTPGGSGGLHAGSRSRHQHDRFYPFSGFNCRVPKPKGPRSPPAQWSRLER